jgi:hypothetical protein
MKKRILVEARNQQVESVLQMWFRDHIGSKNPLTMFCMGTSQYMSLTREVEHCCILTPPNFTPESTEFVALRRQLFTLIENDAKSSPRSNATGW